ncbi:MAG: hypothetical protein U0T81_12250 [Saprospiraceae bacterium]
MMPKITVPITNEMEHNCLGSDAGQKAHVADYGLIESACWTWSMAQTLTTRRIFLLQVNRKEIWKVLMVKDSKVFVQYQHARKFG